MLTEEVPGTLEQFQGLFEKMSVVLRESPGVTERESLYSHRSNTVK